MDQSLSTGPSATLGAVRDQTMRVSARECHSLVRVPRSCVPFLTFSLACSISPPLAYPCIRKDVRPHHANSF